jgi:amino acid adenylation domain-containing protein
LPLSLQKRNSDAPLIRFLPEEEGGGTTSSSSSAIISLAPEKAAALEEAAARLDTTLENLFLAAYASLLSRLTRQDVVAVSVGPAESAIFNLESECAFSEVSRQSQARQATHQVADRIREQGVHYEFRAQSFVQPATPQNPESGLCLTVEENGTRIELASPLGLWQHASLKSWLEYLFVMLEAACQNSNLPVTKLPLWKDSSARDFYAGLNATKVDFQGKASVPGRFAVQVLDRPKVSAVVAGGRQYTYAELDRLSTQLARELVAIGAGPNRAVAVCMERSIDLPMSLLAVLKSGSYYVPLDPHNPSDRLRGILEECQPVALLSDSHVAASLASALNLDELPILIVDTPRNTNGSLPELPSELHPGNLAYTIYTSGTTGKPKGVRITQAALLNLVCSIWQKPGVVAGDRTLAVAPISFDIATMDMFLPICSGGTLILASREDAVDPYRLARLLKEHDITFMQATPATWRMLVASGWIGKKNIKMITGGEAIARELANDLIRLGGELWNCYGPTETAIYSGVIRVKEGSGIVPVGGPIANTTFYVMDRAGYPLPPGVPGELYIGGVGVSPGYVARPELTAERFVPEIFGVEAGRSVFCTGDLVRIVNGNEFEFFGRLDHQVKLRGFRIELGEIETVLRSHPSLSDAVVVLREDIPGEPRLVAYVISEEQVVAADLRDFAAKSLPEYMLPTLIVSLEQFPLSASGKINRRALPIPESIPGRVAADHPEAAAAADELEAKLLKIFRETLRNESIGVTDSFFRYGGYSLLTVRLFSRIDRELGARLPISLLFDAPTVRELARVIHRGLSPSVIVPIRPQGKSAPIFVIQSYLLYNAMLEIVEPDRPIFGVREMGDEREPLNMQDRASKFASEILAVCPSGPLYLAGWCAAGTLTVEIARSLREAGHTVGLVALFDAERPGFAPPTGVRSSVSRLWNKFAFHADRMSRVPWSGRLAYIFEAFSRNWDLAVEAYFTAHYRFMFWLQRRFGFPLSEAAYNNVYAGLSQLRDYSVRPYPGKLNLFRAADVPNLDGIDETLGWGTVAMEGVDVNFVPGDHISMFKKPYVASLAHRLQQELQRSEGELVRG